MKIKPVIMTGGVGARLWPLSCQLYPKQVYLRFLMESVCYKERC